MQLLGVLLRKKKSKYIWENKLFLMITEIQIITNLKKLKLPHFLSGYIVELPLRYLPSCLYFIMMPIIYLKIHKYSKYIYQMFKISLYYICLYISIYLYNQIILS